MADHTQLFTEVYETSTWGTNNDNEYKGSSGGGSAVEYNINSYILRTGARVWRCIFLTASL